MAGFALGELSFVSTNLPVVAAGIIVAGFGVSWFIVGLMTALQMRTPLRLQGRVSSAADVFISTPQTVSIAVGAALIAVVDYRLLVGAESAAVALCAAYLLTRPAIVPAESPQAPSAELLSQPQP
jgi:MFS family permease